MSKLDKVLSLMLWANIVVFCFVGALLVFHSHNYTAAVYCYLTAYWLFAYILLIDRKRKTDRQLDSVMAEWRKCVDALWLSNKCHAALVRRCAGLILALKRAAVKKREYVRMKVLAEREKVIDWQV